VRAAFAHEITVAQTKVAELTGGDNVASPSPAKVGFQPNTAYRWGVDAVIGDAQSGVHSHGKGPSGDGVCCCVGRREPPPRQRRSSSQCNWVGAPNSPLCLRPAVPSSGNPLALEVMLLQQQLPKKSPAATRPMRLFTLRTSHQSQVTRAGLILLPRGPGQGPWVLGARAGMSTSHSS
jgi:hypothetical protein